MERLGTVFGFDGASNHLRLGREKTSQEGNPGLRKEKRPPFPKLGKKSS